MNSIGRNTLLALALVCSASSLQAAGAWQKGAPMPTARSELVSATLDGQIYVAGGLAAFGVTKAVQRYDPATDRWERVARLPVALHHLGLAALGGRLYATGGYTGMDFTADNAAAWVFDPKAKSWNRLADMPGPRAAHAMVALDGKLYVVGGVGQDPEAVWRYDPETEAWEVLAGRLSSPREHLAATVLGGKIYAVGGRWRGRGNLVLLEIFDLNSGTWTREPDMPTPRGGLTAAAVAGALHVTGGEAFNPGRTFDQHEVFDPVSGAWTSARPLPTARHGLTSAAVEGRWYVIGGGSEAGWRTLMTLSDLVEIYDPGR